MSSIALELPKDVVIQKKLTDMHIQEWLRLDVFHTRWWILIALIFTVLFIWWKLLDKSRMREICLFAALEAILAMGMCEYGEELTLWDYPTDIIPLFPPLSSLNLLSLPLVYSLIYQHFDHKKSFIFATVIASAAICFMVEPILTWGGFYHLIHWRYYFSLPIYVSMAVIVRIIVQKSYERTERSKIMRP